MRTPAALIAAAAGLAVATVLAAAACSTQPSLERYCARTQSCACAGGRCCINAGLSCEEGQPCCTGTCTGGVCPGSSDGGADGGADGGGGGGGASCTPGCSVDGGDCSAAACLRDGGCAAGICCQADVQCASGNCLVDECVVGDVREPGESCDDETDCRSDTRCDRTTWPPHCEPFADAGPPACWASETVCSAASQCCEGACDYGLCRPPCSSSLGAPCTRAADCCDVDELLCDGTGHCASAMPGTWPPGSRCDRADQCEAKRCDAGRCEVLDGVHPGAQAACLGVPCEGGALCDAGTCCLPAGGPCVEDRSCCDGQCLVGRCAPRAVCAGPQESCRDDSDCCAPFGCNFRRVCGPTLVTTLDPVPCVLEDNESCRFPFTVMSCRIPGGQAFDLACCRERDADGGLVHCADAGTCTCGGGTCESVDAGYVCPDI